MLNKETKELVKIIDELRIENEQLKFQLRDKLNSVEGGAEEFTRNQVFHAFLFNRLDTNQYQIAADMYNKAKTEFAASQMMKKVQEITGDEIFKYVNKHTDTNLKVREVDAIECVLHFLTQLT